MADKLKGDQKTNDTLELFYNCCYSVFANCPNEYAKAYAKAGMGLYHEWSPQTSDHDIHAIQVQCLYILNNMSHWRGDEAKKVRADLKLIGGTK